MILCICKNVSDTRVRQAIVDGAETLDEVGRACRAGTDCGACVDEIEDLLSAACLVRARQHQAGQPSEIEAPSST